MKKPDVRTVAFGMGGMAQLVCVKMPKNAEGCGLYIHVEDLEKFQAWQKELEEASGKDADS